LFQPNTLHGKQDFTEISKNLAKHRFEIWTNKMIV